ncbi:hypothetical protein [Bifidobacterium italicum]|uniref:hypothetical protein n=1 Tax=Bifidobacterium italicum TaxID=1960968 RepID=UPI0010544147|nr:hypothetical protein [Bifidobacterium italicum]
MNDLQERKRKLPEPLITHPVAGQESAHESATVAHPHARHEKPARLEEDTDDIQDDSTSRSSGGASAPLYSDTASDADTTIKSNLDQG